jgi:hypothetical protein
VLFERQWSTGRSGLVEFETLAAELWPLSAYTEWQDFAWKPS